MAYLLALRFVLILIKIILTSKIVIKKRRKKKLLTKKNNCYHCREESRKGRNWGRRNKILIMKLNNISLPDLPLL